jgi:CheY-like chemotaxis protein
MRLSPGMHLWIALGFKKPEEKYGLAFQPTFCSESASLLQTTRHVIINTDLFPVTGALNLTLNGQPSKPRVLVVDDERVIADTLAIILNQNGFDASAVYTGTAAVDRARETKPDLIISDVIMGDMNGIEAAIRIRQILPGCKILLFSGQAATADLLEKARAQGHEFEILAKPVHPQDLLAKLRN